MTKFPPSNFGRLGLFGQDASKCFPQDEAAAESPGGLWTVALLRFISSQSFLLPFQLHYTMTPMGMALIPRGQHGDSGERVFVPLLL